eukprot:TRINITY_DN29860_c0_g1_i1.p1 TRINITY_DN29860_c0_g1~~TRINITY_DN29860_c0_g1_i1.p1  ORF type:complete len:416 (+),score=73.73 TRINITY_DN29860_c0_g1_i1:44-1291(+)
MPSPTAGEPPGDAPRDAGLVTGDGSDTASSPCTPVRETRVTVASPQTNDFVSPSGTSAVPPVVVGAAATTEDIPSERLSQQPASGAHRRTKSADGSYEPANPLIFHWMNEINREVAGEDGRMLLELMGDPDSPGTGPGSPAGSLRRRDSQASVQAASEPEQVCALCLCDLDAGKLATIQPCGHKYHDDCTMTFFAKCTVRKCPVCRVEIEGLHRVDPEQVLDREGIETMFVIKLSGVRFSKTPFQAIVDTSPDSFGGLVETTSFFTAASQVRDIQREVVDEEKSVYRVTFPPIQLELHDSRDERQASHGEVLVNIVQSTQGRVDPEAAAFTNGLCTIPALTVEYTPSKTRADLLALKFSVTAPGEVVHSKSIYAGVRTADLQLLQSRRMKILIAIIVFVIFGGAAVAMGIMKAGA